MGLAIATAGGINEIRAQYAGQAAFIVLCAIFGGVDGYGSTVLALYAIDSIGFALSISALFWESRI